MPKDYVKRSHKKKKSPLMTKGWQKRLLLAIFFALLISGIVEGLIFWQQHPANVTQLMAKTKSLLSDKVHSSTPAKKHIDTAKKTDEVQFHFYTELPNMQVHVDEATTTTSHHSGEYRIQIGNERTEKEARELRLSLLLAGFEAQLVPNKSKTMFFLEQGPFKSLSDAKKMQYKLKKKGFENLTLIPL